MPDLPISGLPAGDLPLAGTEPVPIVQNNATVQVPTKAFGPVVATFGPDVFGNDIPDTVLFTPVNDALVVVSILIATAVSNPAAGTQDVNLTYHDPEGIHTIQPAFQDLDVSGQDPVSLPLYLRAGTNLSFSTTQGGIFAGATYSFAIAVQLLAGG